MLKIHCFGKHLFSAPSVYLATPSCGIFQTALPLHCCSRRAFTPTARYHTGPHANLIRQVCETGVTRVSQMRKRGREPRGATWRSGWLQPPLLWACLPFFHQTQPDTNTAFYLLTIFLLGPLLFASSSLGLGGILSVSCLHSFLLLSHASSRQYGKITLPSDLWKAQIYYNIHTISPPHLKSFRLSAAYSIKLTMRTGGLLRSGTSLTGYWPPALFPRALGWGCGGKHCPPSQI